MSDSSGNLIPLRNLLNSVQSVRERVRDGEPRDSAGGFDVHHFWDTLGHTFKATSQAATKLSITYSKPPLPSAQECDALADHIQDSVLALATVYFWLPKSHGVTLRRVVRDATLEVLDGMQQLIEVILNTPLQSLTQEQLTSTAGVWASCDQFPHLPKDNQAAVLSLLATYSSVVKDAIEEMEQAQSDSQDPYSDVLEDDDLDTRGNQDTYWSEADKQLMAPCHGLMKAARACLKKLSAAVKNNGKVDTPACCAQLDDLADSTKEISPSVDDLALSLYPPMNHIAVHQNASRLSSILKKVLEITKSSHVCLEPEVSWVKFLDGAIDHNMQKVTNLADSAT
ncbi:cyclin-D1-binding protein 1 homolog [Erpetoichthys calabaricus]|uniref:Cyclin D-type binding-protein 1 n=1 Tax=Erpetoichthys calabaricus TaxID=27687 RepID=A0A8C4S694_ERPCA|nr:cyclin-D1-binding protein 1 homolog [Erpetoichthys calabaricus]